MELRKPIDRVPARTKLQDIIVLSHPTMFVPILAFLVAGTFLADEVSWFRFGALVVGVIFGVVLGAYRINAIRDGGSVLSDRENLAIAAGGLAVYTALMICAVMLWGGIVLLMGCLGLFAIAIYNFTRWPVIHNGIVYGLCWGTFPVVLAYCFQTLSWPSPAALALGVFAGVYARAYTWNHGLRTCGVAAICRRTKDKTCHSNAITCSDRLVMPRSVNSHAKLRIKMDLSMAGLLAVFVILI